MENKICEIKRNFNENIESITSNKEWNEIKIKYTGKKSILNELLLDMKNSENKKEDGKLINELKNEIEEKLNQLKIKIENEIREEKLKKSQIDIHIPAFSKKVGTQNILLKTKNEIENIFLNMGFEVALGQEIESDYYNFEALNLGEDHPARDMQDTFYINPKTLLRTHTSNIQSRVLEKNNNKELKIICPGKVYRRDDDDATHSHQFMQIEGLVVVKKESKNTASVKDLKTILTIFVREIFNEDNLELRLRPSYFPFTEPSVEVDISCSNCKGEGCSFCKKTGWIEILGAGIINPKVLDISGYDSELFTGYAFGIGVERITLLKYNIEDIRNIYENDNEFIDQF